MLKTPSTWGYLGLCTEYGDYDNPDEDNDEDNDDDDDAI